MNYLMLIVYSILFVQSLTKEDWIFYMLAFHYLNSSLIQATMLLNIGGIQIVCLDFIILALWGFHLLKGVKSIKKNTVDICIFLLSCYVLSLIFLGLLTHGINSRFMGTTRSWLLFLGAIVRFSDYKTVIDVEIIKKIVNVLFGIMGTYCAIYFMLAYGAGIVLRGNKELYRPISAIYALCIALYTIYLFQNDLSKEKTNGIRLKTLFFVVITILCRHNSVWMALFAGILTISIVYRKELFRMKKSLIRLLFIISAITVLLVVFRSTSVVQGLILSNTKFNINNTELGTMATRFELWDSALKSLSGVDFLIGQGIGSESKISYLGVIWDNQVHNAYIQCVIDIGFIGAMLLLMIIFRAMKTIINKRMWLSCSMFFAILVYWVVYGFELEQGVVIGCIINIARQIERLQMGEVK